MTTKKLTKAQAEVEWFQARTKEALEQAKLHEAHRKLDELEYKRKSSDLEYTDACDIHHRFFTFDMPISDAAVMQWGMELRSDYRRNGKGLVTINMNSPGGSIYDGFDLMDEMASHQANGVKYEIRVRGMAASMAGVILQQADERVCGANSHIMIHRASAFLMGNSANLEDNLERIKLLEGRIQKIFIDRSGGKLKKSVVEGWWKARKDIWIPAEEALEMGIIDRIG